MTQDSDLGKEPNKSDSSDAANPKNDPSQSNSQPSISNAGAERRPPRSERSMPKTLLDSSFDIDKIVPNQKDGQTSQTDIKPNAISKEYDEWNQGGNTQVQPAGKRNPTKEQAKKKTGITKRDQRIAKTMMDYAIPVTSDSNEVRGKTIPRISRSLLNFSVSEDGQADASTEAPKPKISRVTSGGTTGRSERFSRKMPVHQDRPVMPKTMLDHSVLYDAVFKATVKKEEYITEQIKERLSEPTAEFHAVLPDKLALECPWKWSEKDSTDRVRYCQKCQTPVYNFAGMEGPDADLMIFVRENRKRNILFARSDGKFMTRNCPVAVRHATNILTASIGAFLLLVVTAVVVLSLPKPQAPVAAATAPDPANSHPDASGGTPGATTTDGQTAPKGNSSTVFTTTGVTTNFSDMDAAHANAAGAPKPKPVPPVQSPAVPMPPPPPLDLHGVEINPPTPKP